MLDSPSSTRRMIMRFFTTVLLLTSVGCLLVTASAKGFPHTAKESLSQATKDGDDLYREAGFLESEPIIMSTEVPITFVKNSPVVNGHDITIFIQTANPVDELDCRINEQDYKDCQTSQTTGGVHYPNMAPLTSGKPHVVRARATIQGEKKLIHVIKRQVDVEQPGYCTVHFINNAVTVSKTTATAEFVMTGETTSVSCRLTLVDSGAEYESTCVSPVTFRRLSAGSYNLRLVPLGCDNDMRITRSYDFEVE